MDRPVLLGAFLGEAARTRFIWGERDCALFLGDWAVALGLADPAHDLRGRYGTALGCQRLLTRHGGLEAVVDLCAERVGGQRVSAAILGDVGLVPAETPAGPRPVGAICAGRRWVARAPAGLIGLTAQPLACWRL